MLNKFILDGTRYVRCDDLLRWARWMETADRRVAFTEIEGGYQVSTVFLGLDHRFGVGRPVLFETMVFGDDVAEGDALECFRYSTWEDAEAGHAATVEQWTKIAASKRGKSGE